MCHRFGVTFSLALILFSHSISWGEALDEGSRGPDVVTSLMSMPLSFVENQGQFGPGVIFEGNAGGTAFYFCENEIRCLFIRNTNSSADPDASISANMEDLPGKLKGIDPENGTSIKVTFLGSNDNPEVIGLERLSFNSNFFRGNNREEWRVNVPNYSAILYKDIYPGIDLKYHGDSRSLEYDFIVRPGADPSQIVISYDGVDSLFITSGGDVEVSTSSGAFYEKRPYVYQEIAGTRHELPANFRILGPATFGFELLSGYNLAYPLIIDPALLYSTYLGAGGQDFGYSLAVDGEGNAYVAGYTTSSAFPVVNPFDDTYNEEGDVFVTKFSPAGNTVIYSTFIGGSFWDEARGIAVDGQGNAYITGLTWSDDFPMANSYDASLGGFEDAFITKLSPEGNSLIYSTFLGGSEAQEEAWGIAVDGAGSAYVTGKTNSSNFPVVNAYDATYNGGDAFVTKFSSQGNTLVYSTYLGGSLQERGYDITVDGSGNAYVIGNTNSSDFPGVNAYDGTFNGIYDIFVTKFSSSGNTLEYSTYIGGSGLDEGYAIAVSGSGNAFVTGTTQSTDFPTVNAFDNGRSGGSDAFIASLSAAGNTLLYSSYLGGAAGETGYGVAVDGSGQAVVTGSTSSADFPMVDPYQGTLNGPYDAFVAAISTAGNLIVHSTFLGGSGTDGAWDITLDGSGSAYISGETWSSNFPTLNPYDGTLDSAPDAFVAKFEASPQEIPTLSEWGLLILGLLLLAAGTIAVIRLKNLVPANAAKKAEVAS